MTRLRKFAPGISWHRPRASYHARVFFLGLLTASAYLALLASVALFVAVTVAAMGGPDQIVTMETRRK